MSTPRRGENPPSRCNPATGIFLNDIGGLAGVERPPTPYCGHIPPSHLSAQWEVHFGGNCVDVTRSATYGATHRLGQKS